MRDEAHVNAESAKGSPILHQPFWVYHLNARPISPLSTLQLVVMTPATLYCQNMSRLAVSESPRSLPLEPSCNTRCCMFDEMELVSKFTRIITSPKVANLQPAL